MYTTKDLYLAVALKTVGFPLSDVTKNPDNSKQALFVFEDRISEEYPTYSPEDAIKDFWDHKLPVDASDFVSAINELKTRLTGVIRS